MSVSKRSLYILLAQIISVQLVLANEISGQSLAKVKVSISAKNASLEEIVSLIEDQTDFVFVTEGPIVNSNTRIDLDLKKSNLKYVLEELSREFNYNFKRVNKNIYLRKRVKDEHNIKEHMEYPSLDRKISGKLTDENGDGLPGVNILVKGTNIGTVTDLDGNYSLNVPDDATILIFSFVGYLTEEVDITGRTTVDFALTPDIETLAEVVVIGYGTQQKKEVSGAVAQVDGKELTQAPISTLTNALTGRLPGLTINQRSAEPGRESNEILVRGTGTIDPDPNDDINPNASLVVIDGVANVDGLDRLNPNEIETITILKDASAAIYGAQAANGVILVTTKRGVTGKPQFNYTLDMGLNFPIGLQEVANGIEYATYVNNLLWRNSGWDPNFTPEYTDQELADIRSGVIPTYEWLNNAYRNSFSQVSHNISVRGGSERFKYFASARYLNQGSAFALDEIGNNKQYNLRTNLDLAASDNLDIGFDISLRQQDVANSATREAAIFTNAPLISPLLPRFVNDDPRFPAAARANQNPIAMIPQGGYENNERRNLNAQLKFNYKIPGVEGLAIGGFASYGVNTDFTKNFQRPWDYYIPNTVDPDGEPEKRSNGVIRLDQSHERGDVFTSNFRTTYKQLFGDHSLDVLLQVEKQTQQADRFNAGIDNFLSSASDQFNSGSADRQDSFVGGSADQTARIGYMGRTSYNYKGKYFAQFIFRYDGSERFAEGQRFGFFPGVTASWLLSEEEFIKNNKTISNLKLRASWGQLGNDRIPPFNYLSRFVFAGETVVDGNTSPGIVEAGIANPNVTWEVSETINLGLDVSLFNNSVSFELDVFDTQTDGILAPPSVALPLYTGITPPFQNLGQVQNRGFDFSSSFRKQLGKLSVRLGGNVSFARNKVVFIDEPPFEESYQNRTGRPFGSSLIYHATGIFRTQEELDNLPSRPGDLLGSVIIQDTNGDGEITPADRIRLDKTQNPEWTYGITMGFEYGNFDLSMLWQGAAGAIREFQPFFGIGNNGLAYQAVNSWSPDNVNALWPAPDQGIDTDFFRFENDFIRLKTLQLGYQIPDAITEKIGLGDSRFYVSGFNILTFEKNDELGFTDPEQVSPLGREFPNLSTWNMGINISF